MNNRLLHFVSIISLGILSSFSIAEDRLSAEVRLSAEGSEPERAALARLISELEFIEPMITEAQMKAEKPAETQFEYQALRSDLNKMIDGISDYIKVPKRLPRTIEPLVLDYTN